MAKEEKAVKFNPDWNIQICPKCLRSLGWNPVYNHATDHLIVHCKCCQYSYRMLSSDAPKERTKLFEDMNRAQKIEHIEKCCTEALNKIRVRAIVLADILDVWDYWIPWLLDDVKKRRK